MAGNDRAADDGGPSLSLEEAERLAGEFTPLWEDPAAAAAPPPAPPIESRPAAPVAEPVAPPAAAPVVVVRPPVAVGVEAPAPAGQAAADNGWSVPGNEPPAVELPEHKAEYAPPRPLPSALKSSPEAAPPLVSVEVAKAPEPATPVVRGEARATTPAFASAELDEDARKLDTIPPRSRREGGQSAGKKVVIGVMGLAGVLVAAAGLRAVFAGDPEVTVSEPGVGPARVSAVSPPPGPAPEPRAEVAPAPPPPPPAEPEPAPEAEAEKPSEADDDRERAGDPAPVKASPVREASAPKTARRDAPVRTSRPPKAPSRPATKPPSSSPRPVQGGAIVRESPF